MLLGPLGFRFGSGIRNRLSGLNATLRIYRSFGTACLEGVRAAQTLLDPAWPGPSGRPARLVLLHRVPGLYPPVELPLAELVDLVPIVPDDVPGVVRRMSVGEVLDEHEALLCV